MKGAAPDSLGPAADMPPQPSAFPAPKPPSPPTAPYRCPPALPASRPVPADDAPVDSLSGSVADKSVARSHRPAPRLRVCARPVLQTIHECTLQTDRLSPRRSTPPAAAAVLPHS